jgi:hypothetical protein
MRGFMADIERIGCFQRGTMPQGEKLRLQQFLF